MGWLSSLWNQPAAMGFARAQLMFSMRDIREAETANTMRAEIDRAIKERSMTDTSRETVEAPETIYLDGDLVRDDFPHIRGAWLDAKYANEPPLVYIHADLHTALLARAEKAEAERDAWEAAYNRTSETLTWSAGEHGAAIAERDALQSEVDTLRGALAWYGEQARIARLIHSEGDAGRQALAGDGGKKARAALEAKP